MGIAGVGKTGGGVGVGKCVEVGPNLRDVAVGAKVGGDFVMLLDVTTTAEIVGVLTGAESVNAIDEVLHAAGNNRPKQIPKMKRNRELFIPPVYNVFVARISTLVRCPSYVYPLNCHSERALASEESLPLTTVQPISARDSSARKNAPQNDKTGLVPFLTQVFPLRIHRLS